MRNRFLLIGFVIAFIMSALQNKATAQAYLNFSKYAGGSNNESPFDFKVVNGETYCIGTTFSTNFPVTNGSINNGTQEIVLVKYGIAGDVLYATYIGSKGYDDVVSMDVINNEVYILANIDSSGLPVTNGSSHQGNQDVAFIKINAAGNIAVCTYLGGNQLDYGAYNGLHVNGNTVYISGTTASQNFPVTEGGPYKGGLSDGFVARIDINTGNVLQCKYIGGAGEDIVIGNLLDNSDFYITGTSTSPNLPITTGSAAAGNNRQAMIYKLNAGNLSTQYCSTLGGSNQENPALPQAQNGILYLFGYTTSRDFPVTNGSVSLSASSPISWGYDCFFTKLNTDGSINYSTYLSTEYDDIPLQFVIAGSETYIQCYTLTTRTITGNLHRQVSFYKINSNGTFGYSKHFDIAGNPDLAVPVAIEVVNGEVFFTGVTNNPDYPVTNNSRFYEYGTNFFTKLDPTGNISASTFLSPGNRKPSIGIFNNRSYIFSNGGSEDYPATDSSIFNGVEDNVLTVIKNDGTPELISYIGGSQYEVPYDMQVDASGIYLFGNTSSVDYPVTGNERLGGVPPVMDMFLTKVSFCPAAYTIAADTLSPGLQTVCRNGMAQKITGKKITIDSASLPVVFRNGIAEGQNKIVPLYQWQKADNPAGPWTDIADALSKDFTPIVGGLSQYYRRITKASDFCGNNIIHTSDTATVLVSTFNAPVIDGGGTINTCPFSAVTLGGSPAVSGGNPPYSYQWDMGAGATANPLVAPGVNTIYTLSVTDNAGCKAIGQAVVLTYTAKAGLDKGNCVGTPVQIGGLPVVGVPGIAYSWQPTTGLSNTNISQPYANAGATTDYVLTLTVPKTNGGTCTTKDTVTVTPVLPPAQADFAGPDKVTCLDDFVTIGTFAEPGFNYIWSPGFYLVNNTAASTFYYAGNLLIPTPNPAIINLTAQKNGCSFFDEVEVATIESRAGRYMHGPGIIGMPDRTPGIEETYQWTVVSGPGNFTGPTNLPQVPVGASVGGDAIYGLTVTYKGHSCYSEVTVPEIFDCEITFGVIAKYKCPSYGVNNGDVTIIAGHSLAGGAYFRWSPQEGLDNYNSAVVKLTDNVSRTYTLTVISILDTNVRGSAQIEVNHPAASIPVFNAPDTAVCKSVATAIGLPTVAGYSYLWSGTGLSNNSISNPLATITAPTTYTVRVRESTGCEIKDTLTVQVESVQANAGPDWVICNNGIATLGSAAQPNTNYHWEPQASPWQNGTNEESAQPQVLVATNVTFTVTASSPLGCTATDQVNIVVNNSPSINDYSDKIICKGAGIQIGNTAQPGVSYQWTPATGLNDATIAQPIANPGATTTYTLVATFQGSCSAAATDQVVVTVSDPSFSMADITYCPGNGVVALGAGAPAGMASYGWYPFNQVSNYTIANPTTLNPPPYDTTDFYLTVRNNDGCLYTDSIVLSPSITAPSAGANKTVCYGNTTIIGGAANTTGPVITYSWIPATNLTNAAAINPVFTGTTSGTFTYVLSKTQNGCTSKDAVIVTVKDPVPWELAAPVVCQNTCVQLEATPVPGLQYRWSPATGISNTFIANPVACVGTSSASYAVTITDNDGCRAEKNVTIGVHALPAPQITIPAVTGCVGDTSIRFTPQITPAGSYTYLWSPNDGSLNDITVANPLITVNSTAIKQYSLQVINSISGCANTATAAVTGNICPLICTIGDYMWFDNNGNGIQDAGEPGVSGMLIRLYNKAGANVAAAVTDANGFYSFADVQPDTGYYVVFNKPTGYNFTLFNVGGAGSNTNSKTNNTGRSSSFSIPASATILNIDAGIVPTGPTPVMLLSFTGRLQTNNTVLLNWQTTAEYNNDFFDVERSSDGINFSAIGRVKGNGTTSLPHSYSWVDSKPINGLNYYRLRQVDYDGRFIYSNIVQVQLKNKKALVAFYNSQSNSIAVRFNDMQNNTALKLFAANGQLIKSVIVKNTNNCIIDLPMLATGIYMLQAASATDIYTEKILIRR